MSTSQSTALTFTRVTRKRRRKRHSSVQQAFVAVQHIASDVVISRSRDGRVPEYSAIIEVGATNFALKSGEEQAALISGFKSLLRALRFPLQLLVVSSRLDMASYRARLLEAEQNPLWQPYVLTHAQALESLGAARTLVDRRFYLIIGARAQQKRSGLSFLPSLSPSSRKKREQQGMWLAAKVLANRVQAIGDHLESMGLFSRRLRDLELGEVHYRSLRGGQARQMPLVPDLFERLDASGLSALGSEGGEKKNLLEGDEPEEVADPFLLEVLPLGTPRDQGVAREELEILDDLKPAGGLTLTDVLAPESIILSPDVMQVGNEYVRGISLISYPREVTDGWLLSLLQLDEVFDFSMHLSPQPSEEVVRKLMLRRAQYASTQKINKRAGQADDPYIDVAWTDVDALIGKIASGEECVLEVSATLLLRASDRTTLDDQTERMLAVLGSLLVIAHPTTLEHDEAYRTCQPLCRDHLRRSTTLTSTILATTFPFVKQSLYMPGGTFVGVTPTGEPVLLNPWELPNPHEFHGGISGSGKSYGIKLRIIHELLHDPALQVIIIDPTGEYSPLCQALGGSLIRLAPGSRQAINPCEILPGGISPQMYVQLEGNRLADKRVQLAGFLKLLLGEEFTSRERSYLDRAIKLLYERAGMTADPWTHFHAPPLLSQLARLIEEGEVGEDRYGFAERLEPFTSGSYAGIFSRPTNVDFGNRLICFDIRDLNTGSEELRPLGMYVIAEWVWGQAFYNKGPRRLYIDEAWSLAEYEEGARFMEKLAREGRKYFLSLVIITQNPEKFIATPRGSVIAQNAMTKVLKRLDSVGSKAAQEAFGLTDEEKQLLLSLPVSQELLLVGDAHMIVKVEATSLEHQICTTKPTDEESRAKAQAFPIVRAPFDPSRENTEPFSVLYPLHESTEQDRNREGSSSSQSQRSASSTRREEGFFDE